MNPKNIFVHWKSSTQPILTVFLTVSPFLLIPGSPIHSEKAGWWVLTLTAVAKVGIGFTQKDPGTTEAVLPSGETKPVPSHETPDDKQAVPVAEVK